MIELIRILLLLGILALVTFSLPFLGGSSFQEWVCTVVFLCRNNYFLPLQFWQSRISTLATYTDRIARLLESVSAYCSLTVHWPSNHFYLSYKLISRIEPQNLPYVVAFPSSLDCELRSLVIVPQPLHVHTMTLP